MQRAPLKAGDADHYLSVGGLFFIVQIDVVMQKFAITDGNACLALSACSAATEVGCIDTRRLDRFQHAFVMADMYGLARSGQHDGEGLAGL